MNIDPTLQPLIEALIAYQENQETLTPLVEKAEDILGPEWMNFIQTSLDTMTGIDDATKDMLKKKADHAIHYYGALAAWEEAYQYINAPQSVNNMQLIERIPTLEYWLALFGEEGTKVVNQLKDLLNDATQNDASTPVEAVSEIMAEEQKDNQSFVQETQQTAVFEPEQPLSDTDEENLPSTTETMVVEQENSEEMIASTEQEVSLPTQPETMSEEEPISDQQAQALEQTIQDDVTTQALETANPMTEVETAEEIHLSEMPALPDVPAEETVEAVSDMPLYPTQQPADEAIEEETATETEVLEMLAPKEVPVTPEIPADDPNLQIPKTKNWEMANFMRQKNLYEEATNWISARCVRLGNMDKTEYPYYGFVVDLMNELKENIQNLLENQLLEEVIDAEVPGGREGMQNLLKALEKELEDLPENLKPVEEKNEVDPRQVLGEMDTSQEKEFIGPAPDGFEMIEDPYEVSPEKIIEDYKKTEEEAQVDFDSLNVASSADKTKKE